MGWHAEAGRAALLLAIVALVGVGVGIRAQREPEPTFCQASLAVAVVDGRTAVLEDQGRPGRDRCDRDPVPGPDERDVIGVTEGPPLVLGYDCAVRDAAGTVVATTTPETPGDGCDKVSLSRW